MPVDRWNGTALVRQAIKRQAAGGPVETTAERHKTPTANLTRPKIGVYMGYQAVERVPAYEAFLGRKVDYILEFQATNGPDGHLSWPDYMRAYYTPARLGNRPLSLGATLSSRTVTSPPGDYYARQFTWQQLADGAYDVVWADLAKNLVATGQKDSILRGAHEFNIQIFAHRVLSGEQTAFIAAWRRWHGIVRANGHTGPIHWNPVGHDYTSFPAIQAYPGDAFVDVIDLDMYDAYYSRGASLSAPRTLAEQQAKFSFILNGDGPAFLGMKQWRAEAVRRGKGMAFSEWGLGDYFNSGPANDLNHGGGDNEFYVHSMADFILDPQFPPGSPGGVTYHAFWEHNPDNGVMPNSATSPDSGRRIPVPLARAAFHARFGGA